MSEQHERVSTGVDGLDTVLHGGYLAARTYMVRGEPGAGKSILGLHFLTAAADDETVLYVNLEEPEREIRANAASLGFDLDGVEFLDLTPDSDFFTDDQAYDIFAPDEVEETEITTAITERVREVEPDRVFVDPLTQLRYLSPDEYQFRKEVLAFMSFFADQGATVLFTSQATETTPDDDLQFMSDGIVRLGHSPRGRELEVPKFRGSDFQDGAHTFTIDYGGIKVFPKLVPKRIERDFEGKTISSGVPELDELLSGGIERGTVSMISGPSGVGKTTTGVQFMKEAAGRGERSVIYSFEESKGTLLHRCESINIPVDQMLEKGILHVEEIEALQLSADEFSSMVRTEVEDEDASIVMIDGVEGYQLSVHAENSFLQELHSLCRYLKNQGVTVILVNEMQTIIGDFEITTEGLSYLADNIVFLRHIEIDGRMRKVIGVLKKRTSDFERTVREFRISEYGLKVGEPMTELHGILSGSPEWIDDGDGGTL